MGRGKDSVQSRTDEKGWWSASGLGIWREFNESKIRTNETLAEAAWGYRKTVQVWDGEARSGESMTN
jgi:hypothetical protein